MKRLLWCGIILSVCLAMSLAGCGKPAPQKAFEPETIPGISAITSEKVEESFLVTITAEGEDPAQFVLPKDGTSISAPQGLPTDAAICLSSVN